MSIASIIKTIKVLRPDGRITREEALAIAKTIPEKSLVDGIYINFDAIIPLKKAFPEFDWRVAEDRTGETKYCFVSIEKDEPREHYRNGPFCGHCFENHQVTNAEKVV